MEAIMHETIFHANTHAILGKYTCTKCGFKLIKNNHDIIPLCPRCHNYEFTRVNID